MDVAVVPVQGQRYHVNVLLRPQATGIPALRALLDALHLASATHNTPISPAATRRRQVDDGMNPNDEHAGPA